MYLSLAIRRILPYLQGGIEDIRFMYPQRKFLATLLAMQKRLISLLLWLTVFAGIFLVSTNSITDPDFWWHLKTGEYIVQNTRIPHQDIFSHTAEGRPWTTHEWPTQVILYLIHRFFGFTGIIYFTALTSVISFAIIAWMLKRKGVNAFVTLGSVFLGAVVLSPFVIPRPQIFYFILWVIVMLLLDLYYSGKKKVIFILPFIYLIWANLHASSYLISLLIILFVLSGMFIASSSTKNTLKRQRNLLIVVVIGSLVSLLNVNTYQIYTFLYKIFTVEESFQVGEWESFLVNIHAFQAWFLLALYFMAAVSFLISLRRKDKAIPINEAIVVFAFIGFSLINSKFIPLAVLLSTPFLAKNLNLFLPSIRMRSSLSALFIITIAISSIGYHRYLGRPLTAPYRNFPQKASQFVLDQKLPGKMYNTYNFGGYLIWRLFPRYKIFIDGRHEMYEPDINRDFNAMLEGEPDWETSLEKYDVNFLVLQPREVHSGLATSPNWVLVYFDNLSAIFVKENPQNQHLIEQFGYRHIKPFLVIESYEGSEEKAVIREYTRSLEDNPGIFKSHLDLGTVYLGQGKLMQAEKHLREAIEIFPESVNAHYQMAVLLEKQGKVKEAQVEYNKASRLQ